jgi:hypothetical protein
MIGGNWLAAAVAVDEGFQLAGLRIVQRARDSFYGGDFIQHALMQPAKTL